MKWRMISIVAIVTGLALTGCATTKALNKEVWKDPSAKIGVAVVQFPKAGAHKAGTQGMLDVAINEALASDLQKSLANTDMSAFLKAREKMAAKITDGGLEAVIIEELVDTDALPTKKDEKTGKKIKDLSSFKEKYGVDYLLLLSVPEVGTWRNYYGFVPIGDPKAICTGYGSLTKIDGNVQQWGYLTNYKKSMVNIEGKWNQPPDYPNLNVAIQKAINNAADDLVKNFK